MRTNRLGGMLIALVMVAATAIVVPASPAIGQAAEGTLFNVWTTQWPSGSGGELANPATWKYKVIQGEADNIGSATAAQLDFDDSSWATTDLPHLQIVGPRKPVHYRKDFDLADLGLELHQVISLGVEMNYDDTAVMYLNGVEVYRSIRGNLDPTYATYPLGTDIPWDVNVPYGGYELRDLAGNVRIPDPDGENRCQLHPGCPTSPYGAAGPPAIPTSLLREGKNTFAVTVWNQTPGGSGDAGMFHSFYLYADPDAVEPSPVVINEVMAKNVSTWEVNLDDDPNLETPDWIELRNTSAETVDLAGWTISDASATWTFPAGKSIGPNGYLVLAASDNDDATTDPMQTNFKLSTGGDYVELITSWGAVAPRIEWTDQFDDNTIGLPNDTGEPNYLLTPTLGAANSAVLESHPPVLRLFSDRLFNPGETVDLQLKAFDPDADTLSYAMSPLPSGVALDRGTGALSGSANFSQDVTSSITVTDSDGESATQTAIWHIVADAVDDTPPIVLNEYNAVPATSEFLSGSVQGNGGDWFEFLVLEDDLDLRGYQIEFRQKDGDTDNLRIQTITTFANDPALAVVPAGTLITISEENPDDLSFDGDTDWVVNLQIGNDGNGTYFEPAPAGSIFNSTRRDQTVLIKDAQGQVVTPLTGETDAWDALYGVNEAEVMNLCLSPGPGATVDPIQDYLDNHHYSTFGEANRCVIEDPLDPALIVEQPQDLSVLRDSALLGVGTGDVNCDGRVGAIDALMIVQYAAQTRNDGGPCYFGNWDRSLLYATAADINQDGTANVIDALIAVRCAAQIDLEWCPD